MLRMIKGVRFKSIQAKLSVILVFLITMVLVGYLIYSCNDYKKNMTTKLIDNAEIIADRLSRNLAAPLWDFEQETAVEIIHSEMKDRILYGVIVLEKDGKTLFAGYARDDAWKIVEAKEPARADMIRKTAEIVKEDEKLGGLEVFISKKFLKEELRQSIIRMIVAIIVTNLVIVTALFIVMRKLLIQPVNRVADRIRDIAEGEGDLTMRLSVENDDEIGNLAMWFNSFVDKLHGLIRDISSNSELLSSSSTYLTTLSEEMSGSATSMTRKSNRVAESSDRMSSNMQSVSSSSEQASGNVNMIAAATEQMTVTVNEIAQNSEQARAITAEAVDQARKASGKIDQLENSAGEITKVIEVITEISEQTNLLALNATIEAARAGSAGSGFGVVANEIKELAKQTADATHEIKSKVKSIQTSTSETIAEIGQITYVINDVSEYMNTIATAVEEQSSATKEIAQNVMSASVGIQDVSNSVVESSNVAVGIASEISGVDQEADGISTRSAQVMTRAEDLSGMAAVLQEMVGKFKV